MEVTSVFSLQSFRGFLPLPSYYIHSLSPPSPSNLCISESAPSESFKKTTGGGNESSRFQKTQGSAFLLRHGSSGARSGDRKSSSGNPQLFRNTERSLMSAEPEDRMPLSPLGRASAFKSRRACSFCSVQEALACKG